MIGKIIELLQSHDFKNVSKEVDIAKGRDKYPETWNEFFNHIKRSKREQRKDT